MSKIRLVKRSRSRLRKRPDHPTSLFVTVQEDREGVATADWTVVESSTLGEGQKIFLKTRKIWSWLLFHK